MLDSCFYFYPFLFLYTILFNTCTWVLHFHSDTSEGVTSTRGPLLVFTFQFITRNTTILPEAEDGDKTSGMFVFLPWLLFILSVAALMTELSGETRRSHPTLIHVMVTLSGRKTVLTVGVKHSGDKANRGRLVGILLRELYQKLKCS